jgi:hypothetical protein
MDCSAYRRRRKGIRARNSRSFPLIGVLAGVAIGALLVVRAARQCRRPSDRAGRNVLRRMNVSHATVTQASALKSEAILRYRKVVATIRHFRHGECPTIHPPPVTALKRA